MTSSRTFLTVLAVLCLGAPARAGFFNAADDFSPTNNPNGVWSYGYSTSLGSSFILYTHNGILNNPGGSPNGLDSWNFNIGLNNPVVFHNGTSGALGINGTATAQAGQLGLHPGPDGEYSIVRFTSPTTEAYSLSAAFSGLDFHGPTTTDVHILLNGSSIFDGNINAFGAGPAFSQILNLHAGDTVDFEVGFGSNKNYSFDSTGLSATLSTAVPEPGSFALAGIGVALMAGYGLRNRSRV